MATNSKTNSKTSKTAPRIRRVDEADLIRDWPHIVPGSLQFDKAAGKQRVTVRTFGLDGELDGGKRRIYTSDLFHTFHTEAVKAERDALDSRARSSVLGRITKTLRAMRKAA